MADRVSTLAESAAKTEILRCLREDTDLLLDSICVYVHRLGLATGDEVRAVALEVLQEVSVEALEYADRFEPDRRPIPWLLGIALNVIRRKKAVRARRARREWSGALAHGMRGDEPQAEPQALGQTAADASQAQLAEVEDEDAAEQLLALVRAADREVLRLAVLEGWNSEDLAHRLGTTPGAARVRLHRALGRLRAAWFANNVVQRSEDSDG